MTPRDFAAQAQQMVNCFFNQHALQVIGTEERAGQHPLDAISELKWFLATALQQTHDAAVQSLQCPVCLQNVAFCPECQKQIRVEVMREERERSARVAETADIQAIAPGIRCRIAAAIREEPSDNATVS